MLLDERHFETGKERRLWHSALKRYIPLLPTHDIASLCELELPPASHSGTPSSASPGPNPLRSPYHRTARSSPHH